ncbi:MAG: TlpA family protein disulfide reductase [bacterium]|nr:TlpA family protein disulfide reductase [bacterium]
MPGLRAEGLTMRVLARTVGCVLAALCLVPACADQGRVETRASTDFAYEDINPASSTHGETLALSELYSERGVVLNFFATWCGPCWEELPHIEALHASDAARLVGMAADEGGDPARALYMIDKLGLTLPVLYVPREDVERFEQTYDHGMLPSTYVIDRKGSILEVLQGNVSKSKLEARINELLN